MPKRKKKTTTRSRRRRIGAVGGGTGMLLGVAAGAVVGRLLQSKVLPNVDDRIKSAGLVALGAFFPRFMKGPMGAGVGAGMVAAGAVGLASSFGIGADSYAIPVTIAGNLPDPGDPLQVVSGLSDTQLVAGAMNDF